MTRKMNPLDASWLFVDSQRTPMHVGVLAIFSLPADASPDFIKNLFLHLRGPAAFVAPFNLRLRQPRITIFSSRLIPSWEEDPQIDLDYHLRHSALPQPGGERELGVLVSRLHSHPLDFARPLWECHIIEGLANDRFALYMKMHHSLVDGVGGMRMVSRLLSPDDHVMNLPPPWAVGTGEKKRVARQAGPSWQQLAEQAKAQARYLPEVSRAIAGTWVETLQNTHPELGSPFRAPRSILNGKVSAQRRFATQHYDLARMRVLAKRAKVTLNDVFLGLCASALRRYLEELDALPEQPLTAGLPVSVRPAGDGDSGNAISFIIANLHTHIADPLQRLALIRESTQKAKAKFQTLPKEAITAYTSLFMAPFMLQLMTGMGGLMRPMFNITISNVPGPDQTLYFNGARMDQMYPLSLLSHGQAVNITVVSYAGQFNVGYTGCRDTLPHMQRISVYTGEALLELEKLLGIEPAKD
ncbi:MAG: wax ester/triacylglycerol synthase family O-acyltransferase [Hydrocarboniphaga sp.]|uniref:WS/DGAT/MGAT family O-acyltransferase n=1 Tax=Hydrocarboniphaga sp. TaxID=2033016 RepID=UPI00262BE6AB|nr:wax ester/triacylglycerol synthase family O-acyltransferase [Hydrocarboniphaga sp.]MDB5967790.1 wax ester/triacylglycerol synthase family O-acyltransferase [Hydrocarboniphaga sp.]